MSKLEMMLVRKFHLKKLEEMNHALVIQEKNTSTAMVRYKIAKKIKINITKDKRYITYFLK